MPIHAFSFTKSWKVTTHVQYYQLSRGIEPLYCLVHYWIDTLEFTMELLKNHLPKPARQGAATFNQVTSKQAMVDAQGRWCYPFVLLLPAGRMQSAQPTCPKIAYVFCVCLWSVSACTIITSCTLLPCDFNLVEFGSSDGCSQLCVATMSYKFEIDTKKQRQCRHNNARLTESRNARSKQILVMLTELLTDWEWLPGALLSGLECSNVRQVLRYEISDLFLLKGDVPVIELISIRLKIPPVCMDIFWPETITFATMPLLRHHSSLVALFSLLLSSRMPTHKSGKLASLISTASRSCVSSPATSTTRTWEYMLKGGAKHHNVHTWTAPQLCEHTDLIPW